MGLQFRRGTQSDVTSENFIPAIGEPVYLTDQEQLYIGDGSTVGGNLIGGAESLKDLTEVHLSNEDIATAQSYSVSSNTVTLYTSEGNPYVVNQQVTISSASVSALNGTHTIVSKPSDNQILFELTLADVSSTLITGTITPVIADHSILAFDTANNRFEDKGATEVIGRLDNHSDVSAYGSSDDLGKIIRYNGVDSWSVKRPGESARLTSGQHFFGNDFANGATGNIYTGNESEWTEDSGNPNTDLHSASPGSIPAPPYGDAAYDSTSHDYDAVGSLVDSNDFTLDFWVYLPSSVTNTEMVMVFYATGTQHFTPVVYGTSVELRSVVQPDGTTTPFDWPVISWGTYADTRNKWTHYSIVRKGNDFRAWVDGDDKGAGTLGSQYTYTTDHNFKFSSITAFYSVQYENDGALIGPHYFDLKKAHRDPAGGNIDVPTERVDFNNLKSGINLNELLDVTNNNNFYDGDYLTYHKGLWTTSKTQYGRLYYSQSTAPTGTVTSSDRIGNWTGLTGEWRDMTYANTNNNDSLGPYSADADPPLLLEDSVDGINLITGLPVGFLKIELEADFVLNNLSANSYNAHWLELVWDDGATDMDSKTHFVFPAHTATNTAITLTQKTSIITYHRPGNLGILQCNIDQEQNADYYISKAILSVTKIG